MKLPPFDYACPTTLPEAVRLLASNDDAKAKYGTWEQPLPYMRIR